MTKTLVKERKYSGQYVALKTFEDSTVVGHGKTLEEAYQQAQKKGYFEAVITFVPSKNTVQIY